MGRLLVDEASMLAFGPAEGRCSIVVRGGQGQ